MAPRRLSLRTEVQGDRKSTRLNSSHGYISYAVFCLKKKKNSFSQALSYGVALTGFAVTVTVDGVAVAVAAILFGGVTATLVLYGKLRSPLRLRVAV